VGQTIGQPQHIVLVPGRLLLLDPGLQATSSATALVGVATGREELIVAVGRDPDIVVGKVGTGERSRVGVRQDALRRRHVDLVPDWLLGDRVDLALVDDLEGSRLLHVEVGEALLLDVGADGLEADAVRVDLLVLLGLERQGHDIIVDDRVLMAVDHGVDTDREEMLVVGSKDTWRDDSAIRADLVGVNVLGGEDARRANLEVGTAGLVEAPCNNVLVVGDRQDAEYKSASISKGHESARLENQDAAACHNGVVGAEVRVLPHETVVLLVHADDLLGLERSAVVRDQHAIEVVAVRGISAVQDCA
jgi:hypothetical protein